jgi:hypothetical protein
MSTMQLIFCVEKERFIDLSTSFYFTTVTLTTVGYGDLTPSSPLGRAFIITQIFAAMLAVPLLLAETDRLMKFLLSLTGYAGSDRHVIVFGELTDSELDHLLEERCEGDAKADPLHMVFVAPKFSQEFHDKVAACAQAERMTICIAHQLSRTELARFSLSRGDAAFFYSNTQAAAMRGDYRTIAAAAAVRLHHPSLPQYLMMRRTDTAHLVEGAYVVFDRDFLRAALIGTSLQIPGFLPMFLNLIRYVPSKHVKEDPLMREYKRRRRELEEIENEAKRRNEEEDDAAAMEAENNNNNISNNNNNSKSKNSGRKNNTSSGRNNFINRKIEDMYNNNSSSGDLPKNLREQAILMKMKQERLDSLGRQREQSTNSINNRKKKNSDNSNKQTKKKNKKSFLAKYQIRRSPHDAKIKTKEEEEKERAANINNQSWYNMYLNGAVQNIYTIAVPDVLIGRTFSVASFIVQLRTGALPIGLVRDSRIALNAGNTPIADQDSFILIAKSWEDIYTRFQRFPTTSTNTDTIGTKMALRGKEAQFAVEQHASATSLWLANYHNYFPFRNHVVLVDLASFVSQPELCPEESYQREQFQVRDILALASRFPKWQSFVLLAVNPVSELLQREWAASGRQPIFHIMKSPLDPEALRLCKIGLCMSVLIFSSLHVSNDKDEHFKSALLSVNREVMLAVQVETSGRLKKQHSNENNENSNINKDSKTTTTTTLPGTQNKDEDHHPTVITVIGKPSDALLLSPEHISFQGESIDHDAHCCAFATGCAIAPSLLDGLMFRSYYNEFLPHIIELLLEPNAIMRERASVLAAALFDDEIDQATRKMNKNHKEQYDRRNRSGSDGQNQEESGRKRRRRNKRRRRQRNRNRGGVHFDDDADDYGGGSDDSSFDSSDEDDDDYDYSDFDDDFDDDQDDDFDDDRLGSDADDANKNATNSLYHDFGDRRLPTFGQLCRVMTAVKVICFGFTRVIQTPERGVDTLGKVFFVTNPELGTLIMPDDYIFYLPPWSRERLAEEMLL